MRKAKKIPQRVDEPPHILLWSADELAPLGFVITQFYRRYRENHPDGFLLHILYHAGIPVTKGKSMVNPFIKRLLP